MRKVKSIYETLSNYTKEEIDRVIEFLNEEDKNLLYLRYGNDLESPNSSNWDTKYYYDFKCVLLSKMKSWLKTQRELGYLPANLFNKNSKSLRFSYITIYECFKEYKKEEIDDIINELDDDDKHLLWLRYGSDLGKPDYSNWSHEYDYNFYNKLLPKMKRLLIAKKEGKKIVKGKIIHIQTIYELLSDYTKEEIDSAIEKLNPEEKRLLYLRYGSDLSNPDSSNWDKKYNGKFYLSLINKMKNIMNKIRNGNSSNSEKTIYERLSNFTKDEIDEVINLLTYEEQKIISSKNDLKDYQRVLRKIQRLLKCKREGKKIVKGSTGKTISTIYEILKDYKKEEIDRVIEELDFEDKNLLYLRYGSDLSNPDSSNWSMEYYTEFYKKLLPKLRRRLEKKTEKTIYDYFKEYKKEDIDLAIKYLSFEDKYLIYLKYGWDLNNPNSSNWKIEYNYIFINGILPRIKKQLLLNYKKRIEDYLNCPDELENDFKDINIHLLKTLKIIMQELRKDEYKSLFEMYSVKEILIVLLVKKLNNNYNRNDILKLFNMEYEEFISIARKMLIALKFQEKDNFENVTNALEDKKEM